MTTRPKKWSAPRVRSTDALRPESLRIPVLDLDVTFKKTSHRIREKTATWIGRDLGRNASVLLTLGADHFFGRVVIDDNIVLFEPTAIANQAMSFSLDRTYRIPLINDEVVPPEQPKEFSSALASCWPSI